MRHQVDLPHAIPVLIRGLESPFDRGTRVGDDDINSPE